MSSSGSSAGSSAGSSTASSTGSSTNVGLEAHVVAEVGRLRLDIRIATAQDTLVIVGPNGAGKTTLLSLLLGALPCLAGRVEVGGHLLYDGATGVHVPVEQRRIGFLPQNYALFPHMTVRRNIEFALVSSGRDSQGERARRADLVDAALADLRLQSLALHHPHQLSGGERQRVALARALIVAPHALLLDEPLAALDVNGRDEVRSFLASSLRKLKLPTVLVTHDATDARQLGDQIAVLEQGRITQTGTWDELACAPSSPFVAAFVASGR